MSHTPMSYDALLGADRCTDADILKRILDLQETVLRDISNLKHLTARLCDRNADKSPYLIILTDLIAASERIIRTNMDIRDIQHSLR